MKWRVGENLAGVEFGGKFLDTTLKARSMKENTDKLDFIEMKASAQ